MGIYGTGNRNALFVSRINEIRKNENNSWAEIEDNNGSAKRGDNGEGIEKGTKTVVSEKMRRVLLRSERKGELGRIAEEAENAAIEKNIAILLYLTNCVR